MNFRVAEHSLLDTIDRYPVQWWLVYCDTDVDYWWNRYLRRGFQHVYGLQQTKRGWIAYRPFKSFTTIEHVETDLWPHEFCDGTVQRVSVLRSDRPPRWHIGPYTCVDQFKHLLGIRAPLVRTPYQLYRYCNEITQSTTANSRREAAAGPSGTAVS